MRPRVRPLEWAVMAAASLLLVGLAWRGSLRADETFGFITGGVCVWLLVRQHVLNWPVGLLNNVVFFALFFRARLFADMSLQVVFFALGVYGWWNWVRRGPDNAPLKPTHAGAWEWLAVLAFIAAATLLLRLILVTADGAAPFWDALTTALSLAAQYWLSRKRIDNWWLWIVADAIYVPLYVSRDLPLTAVLYGAFLVMCVVGLIEWRRALAKGAEEDPHGSGDRDALPAPPGAPLPD